MKDGECVDQGCVLEKEVQDIFHIRQFLNSS